MRISRIIAYTFLLLFAFAAQASPAKRGPLTLTQPDGRSFTAIFQGDEFARIKTTSEGQAIVQDAEGWWCYASYDSEGNKVSSGWRVGRETPAIILGNSRTVPVNCIYANAKAKRSSAIPYTFRTEFSQATGHGQRMQRNGIVILAQFKDFQFNHNKEDFERMLMSDGYDRHGATGSAKEYFEAQFGSMVDFSFDVSNIVTLPGKREYYGINDSKGNDSRPAEMIADACRLAAENGIDFSRYDYNNDGKVDNVFVFFAGEDEAEGADENSIWSHSWYLFSGAGLTLELNGKMIDRYACTSEKTRIYDPSNGKLLETRLCGIGTFCHEYSHTFGLPDLYDTDYDNLGGWAAGTWGHTSIMDSGNQNNNGNTPPNFNAIEREILGISQPVIIDHDGRYTLSPIQSSGHVYKMNAEQEGEYYLFECRTDGLNDWDKYIGGSGMLVYHIDKTSAMAGRWDFKNTVNADAAHQCADLIEADGRSDSFADYADYHAKHENIKGIFFPYNSSDNIPAKGTPGLNFWNGDAGDISITEITREEEGKISFNAIGFTAESTPPSVMGEITYEVFCDGVILKFESDRPYSGEAVISYGTPGSKTDEIVLHPYEEGKYAALIEGLNPVSTYTISIHFILNGIKGKASSISFMTKKKPSVSWAYINFGAAQQNHNGTFPPNTRIPLKINNSRDISNVTWKFDGKPINHEGDFYFTVTKNGKLEAYIYKEDGTEEILVKEIRISGGNIE